MALWVVRGKFCSVFSVSFWGDISLEGISWGLAGGGVFLGGDCLQAPKMNINTKITGKIWMKNLLIIGKMLKKQTYKMASGLAFPSRKISGGETLKSTTVEATLLPYPPSITTSTKFFHFSKISSGSVVYSIS